MRATAKLIPLMYYYVGQQVVFKLDGKLILTEITSVPSEMDDLFKGAMTIGVMSSMSIPQNELQELIAERIELINGYKNQPKDVFGFVAEHVVHRHKIERYSAHQILEKGLIDKTIEFEFVDGFERDVKLA